ncbi:MAG: hypothetical protein KIT09_23210 [Bryobacteraceae bacterium]|nr:hypothetical protein [Bryobacteraceae bacterium]
MRTVGITAAAAVLSLMAPLASGDTLRLKDGAAVDGTFLGGDARTIRFLDSGGATKSYAITDISSVEFGGGGTTTAAAPAPAYHAAPPAAAARPSGLTIPAGTMISVRMIDSIDAKQTAIGERFRCSIDDPVIVQGETALARGADCTIQVMRAETGGRVSGSDELALKIYDISVGGKSYDVATGYAEMKTKGEGRSTARNAAVLGGVGAAIGAMAGGGRGAAIGAGAGAGTGVAVSAVRGPHLQIPSETRLTFELRAPLALN